MRSSILIAFATLALIANNVDAAAVDERRFCKKKSTLNALKHNKKFCRKLLRPTVTHYFSTISETKSIGTPTTVVVETVTTVSDGVTVTITPTVSNPYYSPQTGLRAPHHTAPPSKPTDVSRCKYKRLSELCRSVIDTEGLNTVTAWVTKNTTDYITVSNGPTTTTNVKTATTVTTSTATMPAVTETVYLTYNDAVGKENQFLFSNPGTSAQYTLAKGGAAGSNMFFNQSYISSDGLGFGKFQVSLDNGGSGCLTGSVANRLSVTPCISPPQVSNGQLFNLQSYGTTGGTGYYVGLGNDRSLGHFLPSAGIFSNTLTDPVIYIKRTPTSA